MSRLVTQAAERERELARARSQWLKQAARSLPGESVSRGFAGRGTLEGYPSHYTSLDISIAHVIIIIKSELSTFPSLSYFSVVVCLRCLLHHILSLIAYTFRENRESVFIIIVQFMMSANIRIRFGLQIVLVCLYSTPSHYHHPEGIELIKCLSDIFCRLCE